MITVIRKRALFGKRSKRFTAYTSEPDRAHAIEICEGAVGETATAVKGRAVDLLAHAFEAQALDVRAVSPGMDGAPQDVWILHGNPIVGFSYGRVCERFARSTLYTTSNLANVDRTGALTVMLTHMADCYPAELWPQFLWGQTELGLARIRATIVDLNSQRAAMAQGAQP